MMKGGGIMGREAGNEAIKKAIEKRERTEIKRRNLAEYYKKFARWHIPWIKELTERYMAEGDFGIHPLLIAARYEKPMDVEVALTASVLIRTTDVEKIVARTKKMAEVITESPYVWLSKRGFVPLFDPKVRNKLIFQGVTYGKLAVLMSNLYDLYSEFGGLEHFIKWSAAKAVPAECLASQLQYWHGDGGRRKIGDLTYPLSLVLAYLSRRDGIGAGIWSEEVENLHPEDGRVKAFVNTFFYRRCEYFTREEKTALMGFKDGMELYYATLAYHSLREKSPEACNRYERLFQARLSRRCATESGGMDMKSIIPKV